jgi:hypothetical protein
MVSGSDLSSPEHPTRRVVLLGASNLTRAIATVLRIARAAGDGPLDAWAALGHGRSYGQRSVVLGRALPGIVECGLWDALNGAPSLPTTALVTDVGNDILYGTPVDRIAGWVEVCLDRLAAAHARPVLTALPLANLNTLTERRFRFFRSVLFPLSRLTLAEATDRARSLDARLRDMALARGLRLIEPRATWYGIDPIHIRMRHWPTAWGEILSAMSAQACPSVSDPTPRAVSALAHWLRLRLLAPDRRWLLGIEQHRAQPALRLGDGSTVSIY